MATLLKDPISGAYVVKQGDDLTKIATTQGRTLQELLATNPQYAANPSLIHPGDVIYPKQGLYGETAPVGTPGGANYATPQAAAASKVVNTPSYSNLTSGKAPVSSGGSYVPPALNNKNPTTSFTEALIGILKEAQGRNATGQEAMMKQSQGITGLGLNDANMNFRNKYLAPSSGTSLGLSAQNEFDPLQLSIENQQKLASQNLGDITDLVKQSQTGYDNEQDRIARAKENALNRADKGSNVTFDTQGSTSEFTKNFESIKSKPYKDASGKTITPHDNYVDPDEWIAARTLWGMRGGTDSSFVSNFKKYLNPLSYGLAGIGTSDFVPLFE